MALTSHEDAELARCQHKEPCHDCPWRRNEALPGWLGSETPEAWVQIAHSSALVDCHAFTGAQCAGIAIYRANVLKRADPPSITLPKDHEKVFSTPMEFIAYHDVFKKIRNSQ